MYLLDTDIVFELRKAKDGLADAGLTAWAAGVARAGLFISVLAPIELEGAAAALARRDKALAGALRGWIKDRLLPAFEGRVLPLDAAVAAQRARIGYADGRDGLLAATALEHGLTLVTRRTAAFRAGRVKLFDPRGYAPATGDEDGDWRQAARGGPAWLKNLFVRA